MEFSRAYGQLRGDIQLNGHAYNILVKGYVCAGQPGKAEAVLTSMSKYGVQLNVVIFYMIIS